MVAPLLVVSQDAGMEVYFLNVVRATRLVTPIMVKRKSGAIINISTVDFRTESNVFDLCRVPSGPCLL